MQEKTLSCCEELSEKMDDFTAKMEEAIVSGINKIADEINDVSIAIMQAGVNNHPLDRKAQGQVLLTIVKDFDFALKDWAKFSEELKQIADELMKEPEPEINEDYIARMNARNVANNEKPVLNDGDKLYRMKRGTVRRFFYPDGKVIKAEYPRWLIVRANGWRHLLMQDGSYVVVPPGYKNFSDDPRRAW